MKEELLYLVDPDDQVLGQVRKSEAHKNPDLLHREVAVVLVSDDGRALLAQRSWEKPVLPGKWDITCAGHVPWGMTVEEAAHMELREELGFDTALRYVGTQLARYDWESHLTHLFVGAYRGEEVCLQEEEVADWGFYSLEEALAMGSDFNAEFREFLRSAMQDDFGRSLWKREEDLRSIST